jgi:DNA-binding SARP family transcriptional activator
MAISKGKEAKNQNLNDDATRYFETAFNLYNGDIAFGVDGLWIESMRTQFYNDYIDTIESLLNLYESNKSNNIISKALEIYPDDKQILELSKNL